MNFLDGATFLQVSKIPMVFNKYIAHPATMILIVSHVANFYEKNRVKNLRESMRLANSRKQLVTIKAFKTLVRLYYAKSKTLLWIIHICEKLDSAFVGIYDTKFILGNKERKKKIRLEEGKTAIKPKSHWNYQSKEEMDLFCLTHLTASLIVAGKQRLPRREQTFMFSV